MRDPKNERDPLQRTQRLRMQKKTRTRKTQIIQASDLQIRETNNETKTPDNPPSRITQRIAVQNMENRPGKRDEARITRRIQAREMRNRRLEHQRQIWRKRVIPCLVLFVVAVLSGSIVLFLSKPPERETRQKFSRHFTPIVDTDFYALDLAQIRDLPDREIDLAWTALLVAQQDSLTFDKKIPLEGYMQDIDILAERIQRKIDDSMEAEEIIAIINEQLYKIEKFKTSQIGWDPSNLYLNLILEGKQAYCLGYTELWMALGERVHWRQKKLPIYAVLVPHHIFCRWEDDQYRRNIETLHVPPADWKPSFADLLSKIFEVETTANVPLEAGRHLADSFYKERYNISEESIKARVYLKTVDKKAVISCIYSNRAGLRLDQLEYEKDSHKRKQILQATMSDLEQAIQWFPHNTSAKISLAVVYTGYLGRHQEAIEALHSIEKVDPYCRTFSLMAHIYADLGDAENALAYLDKAEKALAYDEKEKRALPVHRAMIYYKTGQYQKVRDYWEELSEEDNDIFLYSAQMASIGFYYIKACNKLEQYQDSLLMATALHQLLGDSEQICESFGEIYRLQGLWQEAIEQFNKVLHYNGQSLVALKGLGECHFQQEKYREAILFFAQGLAYSPQSEELEQKLLLAREKLEAAEKESSE